MQNPIVELREARGWSQEHFASLLKLPLTDVISMEEGIPNLPPGVVYLVMSELLERTDDYQAYRHSRREEFMSSLDECVGTPQNPEEFRHWLHNLRLTPAEFSRKACIPLPEVFYAMKTRLPASITSLLSCTVL